ncbi:MAG TPA: DinB family protein [Kofleriaceae bacterium]|jgi:uncharacterized damage-inducible protein DinB|nr:DinB family protein [Kofleriaceae bacterium]
MRDVLIRMAHQNAWANHRLANAIAQLDDAAYKLATRTSFFPSIHLTLVHILFVDRYYADALEDGGLGRAVFDDEDRFARDESHAETRAQQRAIDQRLIAITQAIELDKPTRIPRADHVQVEKAHDVLLHVFEHQIHHRGQVHAMLAGTSVEPPQLDEFFLAAELPLRAAELTELGLPLR